MRKSKPMGHFGSKVFTVRELCDNRMQYQCTGSENNLRTFLTSFPELIQEVHDKTEFGVELNFEDDDITVLPYYKYIVSRLNSSERLPTLTAKGRKHAIKKVRDAINLFYDVRDHGLKSPIDMIYDNNADLKIIRGGRRLVIINILGYKTVPVRTFRSRDVFLKYTPTPAWTNGHSDESIWNIAAKQFSKLQEKATDKYWVHNYIPLYERHVGHLRKKKNLKVLELGVSRGASLLLWKEVFPTARIYGLDKNTAIWQNFLKDQDRITVFTGRQESDEVIQEVIDNGPYDIIIDDASHTAMMQQRMLDKLWDSCLEVYVVEDLRSGSYLRKLKRPKSVPRTTDVLKGYVDRIHKQDEIRCMAHYYDICFLEKLRRNNGLSK